MLARLQGCLGAFRGNFASCSGFFFFFFCFFVLFFLGRRRALSTPALQVHVPCMLNSYTKVPRLSSKMQFQLTILIQQFIYIICMSLASIRCHLCCCLSRSVDDLHLPTRYNWRSGSKVPWTLSLDDDTSWMQNPKDCSRTSALPFRVPSSRRRPSHFGIHLFPCSWAARPTPNIFVAAFLQAEFFST